MNKESNIADRFVRRLKKIGIEVSLCGNFPWIYLTIVNGKYVEEKFHANHGFTAFWYPVGLGEKIKFTDRRKVFEKVREMIKNG